MAKQKQVTKTETKVESKVETKTKPAREAIVRAAIKESLSTIDTKYVDLAAMLSEAYHRNYHKTWGFDEGVGGWKEYCANELEIHHRKAYHFIEIHDKIKALDLNPKDFEKLGWTKMKEIVTVMTTKNAKEWLEKAKKMSQRELAEACKIVRRKQGRGRDDVPTISTIKFQMDDGQMRILTDALNEGKGLLDTENTVQALIMIMQDWMETKGVSPQVATLDDHVKFLEEQFGVAISFKKVGKSKEEKAKETAKAVSDAKVDAKKKEKEKVVAAAKKKAMKEGKKQAEEAADDLDDLLSDAGGTETDDDIDAALGLD